MKNSGELDFKANLKLLSCLSFSIAFGLSFLSPDRAWSACGGTTITWSDGTFAWNRATNWTPANIPDDPTEDVIIVSAKKTTSANQNASIGCLEIQSGRLDSSNGTTLTINGDYFRNLNANSLSVNASDSFVIDMAGTANQTFENVDTVNTLTISNNNTVTFTQNFSIRNALNLSGSTTILKINSDVTIETGSSAFTIPSGVTVEVNNGGTFHVLEGVTIAGTLKVNSGGTLKIGDGKTLQVNSGGILQLNGSSGNVASVTSEGAVNTFTANIAGQISGTYFRIDRLDTTGLNVTGTISQFSNGEFHFLSSAGTAITLGSSASLPSTMDNIGFFDDDAHGNVTNINATLYTGSVVTLNDWAGSVGGSTNEVDPSSKVDWGAQGGTTLSVLDNTPVGVPPSLIDQSSPDTHFATFQFALNQSDTATDITEVTITMTGTGSSSDVSSVKLYRDGGGGTACQYDSGVDIQIGSGQTMSGSPAETTFTIGTGLVTTSSDSDSACIHIIAATSSNAQDSKTLQFSIQGTSDITNSQGYAVSDTAGPPVSGGSSAIQGSSINDWQGASNDQWDRSNNWLGQGYPNSSKDCRIGLGSNVPRINLAAVACLNTTLQTNGSLNFESLNRELGVYGTLEIQSSFSFVNASSGNLVMRGASNQSISAASTYPGNFQVNNTGTSPNNIVSLNSNFTVSGLVVINSGVLRVTAGNTLTAVGGITVKSGATLDVEPGGTVALGNGSLLTVDSGGILQIIGVNGNYATVTSNSGSNSYSVVINGEIQAQYYNFDHLGTNGVTISTGATINSTNHLQYGSFTYPVNNNTTLLKLREPIPGNTIEQISFSLSGSSAVNIINIDTTGASAGTLNISSYAGDLAGPGFDSDPEYLISWAGATNTIRLTTEANGPSSLESGNTYNMGRFGFQQAQAGTFNDTDITKIRLTLVGTGTSSDVTAARLFYDSNCDSTGGFLLGTQTFSGSPARATFNINLGAAPVHADATSPPKRCVYVEFDISTGAGNGNTLGVKINTGSETDFDNSEGYAASGDTVFPVQLGSPGTVTGSTITIWTGTTDRDWFKSSNWSNGLPDTTLNCEINDVANDPEIDGAFGTAQCKNITIGNGIVVFKNATGALLEVGGNYNSSGTIYFNDGTLRIVDGGSASDQTITSNQTLTKLDFVKPSGGSVNIGGTSLTVNNCTIDASDNFELRVASGKILILPIGISLPSSTLKIFGGGTVRIGNGQSISVTGGSFIISGTHDSHPQNLNVKGKVTVDGSGTWGFSSTSGTVSLTGFVIDFINSNGLDIGGTTTLSAINGGQFTNLPMNYASMTALKFNTSSLPTTANDVGFNWGSTNTPPDLTDGYTLVSSTGCGDNSINFDQWFGDFFQGVNKPDTSTKISATSCSITMAASASPVSLTSLFATPYDRSVVLSWTTGSELDHAGFNVYRSTSPVEGFIQVNKDLIRNILESTSFHGKYRFEDVDLTNDVPYYYIIEDVAYNGVTEQHGPIVSVPNSSYGAPPSAGSDENSSDAESGGDNGNSVTPTTPSNPDVIDLGHGVHILEQTLSSLRVEILPPPLNVQTSSWNSSYKDLSIPGYSKSLVENFPELPERQVLIEIDQSIQSISSAVVTLQSSTQGNIKVTPAPSWSPDSEGILQPSWNPDTSEYSNSNFSPDDFFEVSSNAVNIASKNYVKISIKPVKYQASTDTIDLLNKLVIDIGLKGEPWVDQAPSQDFAVSPSAIEGGLAIKFNKSGLYKITYSDLLTSNTLGPFEGADLSSFRLYLLDEELPLEIISSDGIFNSGDELRFYLNYIRNTEDNSNEAILSRYALFGNPNPPLRVSSLDASPGAYQYSPMDNTAATASAEENLSELFDTPLGDFEDHFYWTRIFRQSGQPAIGASSADFNIDLPGLVNGGSYDVFLRIRLRARASLTKNGVHHISIGVNDYADLDNITFQTSLPTILISRINSSYFRSGINKITITSLGDGLPPDDWEIIDIDRFDINYRRHLLASEGPLEIQNPWLNAVNVVEDVLSPSTTHIYDISDSTTLTKLGNYTSASDGFGSYYIEFLALPGANDNLGYRLLIIDESEFLSPSSLSLNEGYPSSLRSSMNQADILIIGTEVALDGTRDYINFRQSQDFNVVTAQFSQVFDEFSHGQKSSQAIKDFVNYSLSNWQNPKPRYLILLGDATYDPRGINGYNIDNENIPIPLLSGDFMDFGSDNFFTSSDNSYLPRLAMGRIPSSDPNKIESYFKKVMDYESGTRSPSSLQTPLSIITDKDSLNEGFSNFSQQLSNYKVSALTGPSTSTANIFDRSLMSDADLKSAIINEFQSSPFAITYIGHGAEDRWASASVFTNSDADSLSNNGLPLVIALNCLNAHYYQADPSIQVLGEKLILNSDGGAIAFWGSTAMTFPNSQVHLAQSLLSNLEQEAQKSGGSTRLGDLILTAKVASGESDYLKDAIQSYTLLGDPVLKIPGDMFKPPSISQPTTTAPATPANSGGKGGCSAGASEISSSASLGLGLEWVFILLCAFLGRALFNIKRRLT